MSEEELETLRYVDCSSSEIEIVNKAVDTIKKIQQENITLKQEIKNVRYINQLQHKRILELEQQLKELGWEE